MRVYKTGPYIYTLDMRPPWNSLFPGLGPGSTPASGSWRLITELRQTIQHCQSPSWKSAPCIRWWLQEERFISGALLQVPSPPPLLYTDLSQIGWWGRVHPQDLTAAVMWPSEEKEIILTSRRWKCFSWLSTPSETGHWEASGSYEQQCHSYGILEEARMYCISRHVQINPS